MKSNAWHIRVQGKLENKLNWRNKWKKQQKNSVVHTHKHIQVPKKVFSEQQYRRQLAIYSEKAQERNREREDVLLSFAHIYHLLSQDQLHSFIIALFLVITFKIIFQSSVFLLCLQTFEKGIAGNCVSILNWTENKINSWHHASKEIEWIAVLIFTSLRPCRPWRSL